VCSTNLDGPPDTAIPREAKFLDKFSLRGVEYSTVRCRIRNSHVLFRHFEPDTSRASNQPESGQITHISSIPLFPHHTPFLNIKPLHPGFYLCVRPYLSLQPELSNIDEMYRRFGFAGGFLCRRELAPPIIIEPCGIISHIAVTPLDVEEHHVMHILPMDRVRLSLCNLSREKTEDPRIAHADTP